MIKIPGEKKLWVQTNTSDVLGNIYSSFNIDITEQDGRLRAGKRLLVNTDNSDLAATSAISYPVGFRYHNDVIYSVAGSTSGNRYVLKTTAGELQGAFIADTTTNCPFDIDSRYSDIEIGPGKLYVTSASKMYECDSTGNWHGTTITFDSSSFAHMLTYYGDRIYATDTGSAVRSVAVSTGIPMGSTLATIGSAYTIRFANTNGNIITFLRSSASRIWIGTVNRTGGKGAIYEWDGVSNQPTRVYKLEAAGALACVIKDDIPWVMDTDGNLLAWNGGAFQIVTSVNRKQRKQLTRPLSDNNDRAVHPNGMTVINGRVAVLLNGSYNDSTSTQEETIPSGVYEYDPKKGLVHKYSLGLSKASDTITDYGQARVSRVGALYELISPYDPSGSRNGVVLAGATVFTNASSTKSAFYYDDLNDTKQKAANFITTKIETPNITEEWQAVVLKYRKFLNSTDKIVFKYRLVEADPTEATITWTSSTTFTTTADVSGYAVGDEIEVVQGIGAGKTSHISSIVNNTGTYTVTVDETYTSASGTAKVRFSKWIKLGEIADQTTNYKRFSFPAATNSTWIQFKVGMIFTGKNELEEIQIISTTNQPSK